MIEFDVQDIGTKVLLTLDPRSDPIAMHLGASIVQVQGRIKGLADDYLTLSSEGFIQTITGPVQKKDTQIRYKDILRVKYLGK